MMTNTNPVSKSTERLETKYGKVNKVIPTKSGTSALCFFPYEKKPKPMTPKIILKKTM